jgi:CRISPR-associated protein Csm2
MRALEVTEFSEEDGLADSLVQYFVSERKELKATQLRKIFQAIKIIQRKIEPQIRKNSKVAEERFDRSAVAGLMVNLAYAKGRRLIPDDFYNILKQCLSQQKLQTNEDFMRVADFTEAILAYYKFRGGSS